MRIENKTGKIISAQDAIMGKSYSTVKSNIVVTLVEITKRGAKIFESSETGNKIGLESTYLLREIEDQGEVKEMVKKNENAAVVKSEKPKKVSKTCIDYALLAPIMASGLPVKVLDILKKVKVEETTRSPYFRVYSTLEKQVREKVLKFLGKGTFQLAGSNKKSELKREIEKPIKKVAVKKAELKKTTPDLKVEKKVKNPKVVKPKDEIPPAAMPNLADEVL